MLPTEEQFGCLYCYCEGPEEDRLLVPDVNDDEEWARLAKDHAPDCEWITTRAHQINPDTKEER